MGGYAERVNDLPAPTSTIRSYILRIWCEGGDDACAWRASLMAIPGGERVGFTDLERLLAYLQRDSPSAAQQTSGGSSSNLHPEESTA